jgi:hypothetical protein
MGSVTTRIITAGNFIEGFATQATASGTLTLTASSVFLQYFTGTVAGQIVAMPVASTSVLGQQWQLVNNSTASIAVQSSGGNLLQTMAPNSTLTLSVISLAGTDTSSWSIQYIVNNAASSIVSADDLTAMTFKASVYDSLTDSSVSNNTTVDYGTNKTDATLLSVANQYIRLNYDASKTVAASTTTTNLNISAVAAFTVKIGDFAIYGSEVKRITAVASQSSFTTEAFSVAPTLAGQVTISQGIYTKDLNAFAGDGLAPSSAFSTTISQILINYEETAALNDVIFDANVAPIVAYSASSDGTTYSSLTARPTNLSDSYSLLNLPTSGTNLFIRFVANKTSGSGALNLLSYKAFFHRDQSYLDGSVLNQAYCFTDGTGTEINCLTPSVFSGKTRIQVTGFTYPVGVNSGYTNGSIKVYLNGSKIPRFVDSVITPDAYYKEIDQQTIELDSDYSALNFSLELIQDVAVVDNIDVNTSNISYLQEINQQGFQGFVNSSTLITPTTTTGTPAAGTFYSSITNRASIPDLTANLRAQMGIERIMTQQLQQLQSEFGPNGEIVWATPNDLNNQIRFVGPWTVNADSSGQYINTAANSAGYVEIVFYGTGLNLLAYLDTNNRNATVSVDGGAAGANIIPQSASAVLGSRNYSENSLFSLVSGLSLGVHTVKFTQASASFNLPIFGFEILNEASTIKVNPGTSYVNGKKLTLNSQQSLAYNSSFESGTLGTRGGRVIVYQKSDGTIAKAVQPTDAASATLASASHANEEMIRQYHVREFGAGRADDFSSAPTSANYFFLLDDGTTSLRGSSVNVTANSNNQQVLLFQANAAAAVITFVGTGLDILQSDSANGGSDNHTISVDGATAVAMATTGNTTLRTVKIVSGLPYGTHTVKFTRVSAVTFSIGIAAFKVYGPKKPSLPSGAIELADYNIMATYAASSGDFSTGVISTGVLTKSVSREVVLSGSTWSNNIDTGVPSGHSLSSTAINDYIEYSFVGTGIEVAAYQTASGHSMTVQIDGVAYTGAATATTGSTWTSGTSTFAITSGSYCTLQISTLTFGFHKIRVTNATNTTTLYHTKFDIITPIHSPKSNLYGDLQNTLPVGSCAISDNRKTSAIKEVLPTQKAWAQALGILSSPTTTSTSLVPMPDMSLTVKISSNLIKVSYAIQATNTGAGSSTGFQIYIDGVAYGNIKYGTSALASITTTPSDTLLIPVSPGTHKVDLYWTVDSGTGGSNGTRRNMTVEEK